MVSLDDFEEVKVLGRGMFGKVVLVKKSSGWDIGKLYAMKILPKNEQTEFTKMERMVMFY